MANELRLEKLEEQIKRDLGLLILESARDARLKTVTVLGVEMTRDLELAKVYVAILGEKSEAKKTFTVLKGAAGYLRTELASLLGIRRVPELRFILDRTVEQSIRIDGILNELGYPREDDKRE